jgi:hypothetical protein
MRNEISRVREEGTVVTQTDDSLAKVEAIRAIVTQGQYAKVNGVMVDLFSASAMIGVYDALNDVNKAKYRALPVAQMATIAFKLCK